MQQIERTELITSPAYSFFLSSWHTPSLANTLTSFKCSAYRRDWWRRKGHHNVLNANRVTATEPEYAKIHGIHTWLGVLSAQVNDRDVTCPRWRDVHDTWSTLPGAQGWEVSGLRGPQDREVQVEEAWKFHAPPESTQFLHFQCRNSHLRTMLTSFVHPKSTAASITKAKKRLVDTPPFPSPHLMGQSGPCRRDLETVRQLFHPPRQLSNRWELYNWILWEDIPEVESIKFKTKWLQ